MPDKAAHLAKAEHNEDFVKDIGNPYFDWQVVGLFYAAMHYIEAYLAKNNLHSPDHTIRTSVVQKEQKLRGIYVDYRELLNESRSARYEAIVFGQSDVTRLQRTFSRIKSHILPLI